MERQTVGRSRRGVRLALALTLWVLAPGGYAQAQEAVTAADSTGVDATAVGTAVAAPAAAGLPAFLTLGVGYGLRSDPCAHCSAPENTESFSAHVSLGKYLGHGLGVGVDASVWRRGHPGPLGEADSTGVQTPTTLSNMLGNASLTFSYQVWHVFVRAGGGVAWAHQDVVGVAADGDDVVSRASGLGIGYSAGGGLTVPLASVASLVFFGNWNAGRYDLVAPTAVLERDAKHQYLELGMGITVR